MEIKECCEQNLYILEIFRRKTKTQIQKKKKKKKKSNIDEKKIFIIFIHLLLREK